MGNADPGGCICTIYFKYSKCDTFSLLANTHDPEKRFQKLNELHRRLSHWNWHTDSIIFVARSHHCHLALAMINNASNDSLPNWMVLWTLTYPVLLVKALRLLIQLRNGPWVTDLCPTPECIFCHSDGCKKTKKAHYWTIKPLSKLEFGGGEILIKTAEAENKIMISCYGSKDRTFVIVKLSFTQDVWKGTQHTQNYGAVWMLIRSSGSILKFHTELHMNKCAALLMTYLSKRREPWRWHTYWKSQQHTSNKCITKPLSWLIVWCQLRKILHMPY